MCKIFSSAFYFICLQLILTDSFPSKNSRGQFYEDKNDKDPTQVFVAELENGKTVLKDVTQEIDLSKIDPIPAPELDELESQFQFQMNDLTLDYILPKNVTFKPVPPFVTNQKNQNNAVTVEVLVVVDSATSKRLGSNTDRVMAYLGEFWRRVDSTYHTSSSPRIHVKFSVAIIHFSPQTEPFISNNKIAGDQVTTKVLDDFRTWLLSEKRPKHDVALLALGHNVPGIAGLAYVGGTCSNNGYQTGFYIDYPASYSGMIIASHELAHTLNVKHDIETRCGRTNDIMATDGGRTSRFSYCSLEAMRNFARTTKASCLRW